jgi:hypothetical protein
MNMGEGLEFVGTRFYNEDGDYLEFKGLGKSRGGFSNNLQEVSLFESNNIEFFRDVMFWGLPKDNKTGYFIVFNDYGELEHTFKQMYTIFNKYNDRLRRNIIRRRRDARDCVVRNVTIGENNFHNTYDLPPTEFGFGGRWIVR